MNEYERDRIARNQVAIAEATARAEARTRTAPSLAQAVYDILTPREVPEFPWEPGTKIKAVQFVVMFYGLDSRDEVFDKIIASIEREGIPKSQAVRFLFGGDFEVATVPGSKCKLLITVTGPYVPSVWRQM